jgi:creatinine amidohydrolase
MWRDAYTLLRQRSACAPQRLREVAALDLPELPFATRAVRSFVTTGVGSSAAHATLLAHLLAVELGLPARFAPAGAFVAPARDPARDVLIAFSQGLSPNARLALAHPTAWRSSVLVTAVTIADEGLDAERRDALDAFERAGGRCIRLPGGAERGTLLRIGGPLAGYAIAHRLAASIGRAAGLAVDHLAFDAEVVCARMAAAAATADTLCADGDPLAGHLVLLASSGYGELAGNLVLKVQEGLAEPPPPLTDLIGFAHGPFQAICARDATLLVLQRAAAPLEAALVERLRAMIDPRRHRLVVLPAELPGTLALFEHEALLNELVLRAIAARGIDQARWPGRERDRPLYEVAAPAPAPQRRQRGADPPRDLATLTWPQLDALLRAGRRTAVLPLGATEQHGPHLPFATDTWIADALAERFCARVPEAVRLPALPLGCSSEHAAFPGTLSLSDQTLAALLRDTIASLARHGFDTLFVFSAHGGNDSALRAALPELRAAARPAQLIAFTGIDRLAALWEAASRAAGVPRGAAGHHAGEFETSIMLGLEPAAVRRDALAPGVVDVGDDAQALFYPSLRARSPSGVVGDPRPAEGERAERYLGAWVDALVDCYRSEKKAKYTAGTQSA